MGEENPLKQLLSPQLMTKLGLIWCGGKAWLGNLLNLLWGLWIRTTPTSLVLITSCWLHCKKLIQLRKLPELLPVLTRSGHSILIPQLIISVTVFSLIQWVLKVTCQPWEALYSSLEMTSSGCCNGCRVRAGVLTVLSTILC